jgi:hypothetical protein
MSPLRLCVFTMVAVVALAISPGGPQGSIGKVLSTAADPTHGLATAIMTQHQGATRAEAPSDSIPKPSPAITGIMQHFVIIAASLSIGLLLGMGVIGYFIYKSGLSGAMARASGADSYIKAATGEDLAAEVPGDAPPPQEEKPAKKWYKPFSKG